TITDDEQADGVLCDQSGKLSSKGARLLRGRSKTLGTIDLHVASRVRERRIVLGISQRQMATTLGLTFQQVHKYEQASPECPIEISTHHVDNTALCFAVVLIRVVSSASGVGRQRSPYYRTRSSSLRRGGSRVKSWE